MKKRTLLAIISFIVTSILFYACQSGSGSGTGQIASDTISIALGKKIFEQNCSSCHSFRHDGIGPALSGVTSMASPDWLKHFIKDPVAVIQSGDSRAKELLAKFHTMMPSFTTLADKDLDAIIAFLNTHKAGEKSSFVIDSNYLRDPIKTPIAMSDLVVGLEELTAIPHSGNEAIFNRIAKMDVQPNTNNIFVLDLNGKLYNVRNGKPVVYFDMPKLRPSFIPHPGLATGFGSFAFHPEFAKNGLLYTTHTELPSAQRADFRFEDSIKSTVQWVVTEWKTDHPGQVPFSGKSRELFRVNMVTGIHGMQEITFNPLAKPGQKDYGLLYIGIGDGGCAESGYPFLAHHLNRIWGTILRIDPRANNSANGHYGIPDDNPFSKSTDGSTLKEIYAYGFRNPHRITWSQSGQMMATNIGHGNIESLNFILPAHDYGWPIREGSYVIHTEGDMNKVYALPANDSIYKITYPVAEYDHGEGNAISGGYEYWGSAVPALKGKYLFGDISKARLFYVEMADLKLGSQAPIKEWRISLNGKDITLSELCGRERPDLRFGRDGKGEIYIFTKADGKVYKLATAAKL
ncbi:MAG: PQQ-dependent sugar dehydrogenase [Flavitalea sp.]